LVQKNLALKRWGKPGVGYAAVFRVKPRGVRDGVEVPVAGDTACD
jgi:hypothetical protein